MNVNVLGEALLGEVEAQRRLESYLRTLARRGLEQVGAGIALQAYLPDSYPAQKRINAWARERVRNGGRPLTIRLVKGANLEMERVEASLRGWSSAPTDWLRELTESWTAAIEFVQETDGELADRVCDAACERVRFAAPERVPQIVLQAAAASGVYVARAPVLMQGRVELLWYLREQSISIDYHRYGNLSIREGEQRLDVS